MSRRQAFFYYTTWDKRTIGVFSSRGHSSVTVSGECDEILLKTLKRISSLYFGGDRVHREETDCVTVPPDLPEITSFINGDLTEDGREDVLGQFDDGRLYWWEHPPDPATEGNWSAELLGRFDAEGTGKLIGDIDRDGDNDILLFDYDRESDRTFIYWLENDDLSGTRVFRRRPIDEIPGPPAGVVLEAYGWGVQLRGAALVDLDLDGDLDLAVEHESASGSRGVYWWENAGPDGLDWVSRGMLVSSASFSDSLHFGDIDRDGDCDILTGLRWCENNGGLDPESWTYHELPVPEGQIGGIRAADRFRPRR